MIMQVKHQTQCYCYSQINHIDKIIFIFTGQCTIDPNGIYHLVPPAPIECDLNEMAYGTIHTHNDHLVLDWIGKPPMDIVFPWPHIIPFKSIQWNS